MRVVYAARRKEKRMSKKCLFGLLVVLCIGMLFARCTRAEECLTHDITFHYLPDIGRYFMKLIEVDGEDLTTKELRIGDELNSRGEEIMIDVYHLGDSILFTIEKYLQKLLALNESMVNVWRE
jgi:hypothetical protein